MHPLLFLVFEDKLRDVRALLTLALLKARTGFSNFMDVQIPILSWGLSVFQTQNLEHSNSEDTLKISIYTLTACSSLSWDLSCLLLFSHWRARTCPQTQWALTEWSTESCPVHARGVHSAKASLAGIFFFLQYFMFSWDFVVLAMWQKISSWQYQCWAIITVLFSCAAGHWTTSRLSLHLPELPLKVHSERKNVSLLSIIPRNLTVIGLSLARDKKSDWHIQYWWLFWKIFALWSRKPQHTLCSQILLDITNRGIRTALCWKMVVAQGDVP